MLKVMGKTTQVKSPWTG